jgi:hypothetical protein
MHGVIGLSILAPEQAAAGCRPRLDNESAAVTDLTDRGHGLEEALVDALSGHFHEAELGDVEDLACRVLSRAERLAKGRGDGFAIGLGTPCR